MIAIAWFVAIVVSMMINHSTTTTFVYEGIISIGEVSLGGVWSILINTVIIALIALTIGYLSQQHDLSKEENLLPILFFLFFQLLTPPLVQQQYFYNLTTLLLLVLVVLLFTCYQQDHTVVEKGFLISFIFSLITLFSAHTIYFLPLFFLGMIQMQAANFRSIAAMIVGFVTPYWIIWGLGWIDFTRIDFSVLSISWQLPHITTETIPCIVVMMIGLFVGFSNLMNALNENIKTRAKNGFINIVSVYTALLMIIDNTHYTMYLPMLNSCVALQSCYFFTSRQARAYNIMFYTLVILLLTYTTWIYFI